MNNKINNNEIPIQAIELLPWYAFGLLEIQEKEFVEKALLEFPVLQEHLKIERGMIQHFRDEKGCFSFSAIEEREQRLEKLFEREEFGLEKIETGKKIRKNSVISFFQNLFSGDMSKAQYMGLATVSTFTIALLFAFATPLLEQSTTFYPASIDTIEGDKPQNDLLIGLNVKPNDPRLLKILSSYNAAIVTIAGKEGMYSLNFNHSKPSKSDLEELLAILSKQTELIWFVGEAY